MELRELEGMVVRRMLAEEPPEGEWTLDIPRRAERNYTGLGFISDYGTQPKLRLYPPGTHKRWGGTFFGTIDTKVDVGFLVYVDDGFITGIEGFTFGETWPSSISTFEFGDDLSGQSDGTP